VKAAAVSGALPSIACRSPPVPISACVRDESTLILRATRDRS
jgi:hypothetical protein